MALDEIGESRFPPPGRTPREDTAAVMKFYRLPKAFPPAALDEARRQELLRRIGKCTDSGKNKLVSRTQNLLIRGDDSLSSYTF